MRKVKHPRRLLLIVGLVIVLVVAAASFFRLSPSDCTSVEKYDAVTGSCYYDCTTDEDCAAKAKAVDEQLDGFFAESKTKTSPKADTQTPANKPTSSDDTEPMTSDFTGTETNGTIYTVTKDQSLQPTPTGDDKALWELFSRVVGKDDLSRYVQSFEVFNDEGNDSAASVWQSQTPGKWHVNVNAAFQEDKKDLVHTMVHEYGHIVSLNSTQVNGSVSGACPYLQLDEGCANQTSYINAFYDKYWEKYGDEVPADQGQDQDEVYDFYQQNPSAFVTDYAATNYGEDWAETWAMFVTRSEPTGNQEKDQKVKSLYAYPDLVIARNRIRVQIANTL
jgi:hypothetical protein